MKTKHILLTILFLSMSFTAKAQFWKKLKKKAKEATERTILKKTDELVTKKTEKTIDSITEGKKQNKSDETQKKKSTKEQDEAKNKKINSFFGSLEGLPETYEFTYAMKFNIKTNKQNLDLTYYLKPNTSYFGNVVKDMPNNIIVYDLKNEAMVTFTERNGQKMAMKMSYKLSKKAKKRINKKLNKSSSKSEDLNITPIESKTILGYKCDGYQIVNKDGTSKFYITNDAPVSMMNMFASIQNAPKGIQNITLPVNQNSSILEMQFISKKNKKDNMHMVCTALDKSNLTITKSEYKTGM